MLNVLRSIVNVIQNFVDFVVNTIQSFLNLLAAIPRFTAYVFNLINQIIPNIFKPFIVISIIIGILLLILGRRK